MGFLMQVVPLVRFNIGYSTYIINHRGSSNNLIVESLFKFGGTGIFNREIRRLQCLWEKVTPHRKSRRDVIGGSSGFEKNTLYLEIY